MTLTSTSTCIRERNGWPTTRILFALAGTVAVLSATLAATASTWFLLLTAFAGLNQLLYVATGACPASLTIDRLRRATPRHAMLSADTHEEASCS